MLANHLRRKRGVKTDLFLPIFIDCLYGPDTLVNFSHIKWNKIFLSSESLHSKRKDKLKEKIKIYFKQNNILKIYFKQKYIFKGLH